MKVIFLDIDGVLNYRGSRSKCGYYTGIDNSKVKLLKQIVDATNAKIVLTSTWRLGYNKTGHHLENHAKYMKRKFDKCGLEIYDVTEDLGRMGYLRDEEVMDWLNKHDVDRFVILDDEDFEWHKNNLNEYWIQSTYDSKNGGINISHVERAIEMLGG